MLQKKEILVCLAGKSPQIVTEALYCLLIVKKINIEEILVLTSDDCEEDVFKSLNIELKRFFEYYNVKHLQFDRSRIVSANETITGKIKNSSMTEMIFDNMRLLKQSGNNLHCFISGGRKTMSVDMAIALSIFGTDNDRMYHVIASPEFVETKKYFPESEKEAKMLFLIEKPFIKLKYKASSALYQKQNIGELVNRVQEEIDSSISLPGIVLHTADKRLCIGNVECRFQPLVFAVYMFFAKQGKFIRGGKNFSKIHSEALWKLYDKISPSYGQRDRVAKAGLEYGKIDFDLVQKSISIIRNKLVELLEGENIVEFYTISSEGSYADKKYGIRLPKSKIKILK